MNDTTTDLRDAVRQAVDEVAVLDIHTHVYAPPFGGLLLWGIDELLTYHYLIAEVFRVAPMPYEQFWAMSKREQADYIWRHLFVERSPVSEACRGVVTVLSELGLDTSKRDLREARAYFAAQPIEEHIENVYRVAGIRSVIMTNDPFDEAERPAWTAAMDKGCGTGVSPVNPGCGTGVSPVQCGTGILPVHSDPRFQTALRIDPLLNDWPHSSARLRDWGYATTGDLGPADIAAVRRFLADWIAKISPRYLAVSLPPTFAYPADTPAGRLLKECVLPAAREARIPFAMMIGVRRGVNPGLRLGADAVGSADVQAVERICMEHPGNRFLVTMLSRENQHELCVTARKLPNLLVFGCWWYLNNPSLIEELTRMRLELLGLSFVPQHSDARVLEQLIYKWSHSRRIIAEVLADKYEDLAATGWPVTEDDIARDVHDLLGGGNFERFCKF
jgi:hypothetical protein